MVLNKLVCFAIVYSLSNAPAYGLEPRLDEMMPKQRLGRELKVTPSLDIKELEVQLGMSYAHKIIPGGMGKVSRAENALGKPDGEYAEIMPGGELSLRMEKPFSPLTFYNDGRVVVKEQEGLQEFSLAVLVPMLESEALGYMVLDMPGSGKKIEHAWREVLPGLVPGGFDMPFAPQVHVDTIKIVNTGREKLYLDAIIGYSQKKG